MAINGEKFNKRLRDSKFWLSRKINYPLVSPDAVQIPLTNLCNLRCRMCSIASDEAKELSKEAILDIINQASAMGIKEAVLTGGEPFLRKDTLDLLNHCRLKSIRWVVTTNGTVISPDLAEKLVSLGNGHLHFSLEGLEKTNDLFRGEGSFKKTTDAIKQINELRNKNGSTLSLGIACTVMSQNLDDLFGLLEYADTIGVDVINFQPLLKNNANTPDRSESDFWISSNKLLDLDNTIHKIKNYHGRHVNVYQEPDLRLFSKYYRRKLRKSDWRCFGGYKTIFISKGDAGEPLVYTCHGICGNLNEVSLRKAWTSREARKLRMHSANCADLCIQSCYSREASGNLRNALGLQNRKG